MSKGYIELEDGNIHLLNWQKQPEDFRDQSYSPFALGIDLVQASDGPFGNEQYCPPVVNQGPEGSCSAHGSTSLFSFQQAVEGIPIVQLSRAQQYWNSRIADGSPTSQDTGSYARTAAKVLNKLGCAPEIDMPYIAGQWMVPPPAQAVADASGYKLLQYMTFAQQQQTIAALFSLHKGFISGFSVYTSFETTQVAQTGIIPLPQAGESLLGGHLTMFYDCDVTYVYGQNSWGANWGIGGRFKMPWAYVLSRLMSDFWTYQLVGSPIPQPTPTPTPAPITYTGQIIVTGSDNSRRSGMVTLQ